MKESALGKLVSLFSAVRFASAGATKAPVQHSDPLVWPGFQPRPDSEHDCNTKFSNYAVETICEELSKWRGKEGEGWFTQRFSQEDSAQVLALIKQKLHQTQNTGLVNDLTTWELQGAEASGVFIRKTPEENTGATSTHTQAVFPSFPLSGPWSNLLR